MEIKYADQMVTLTTIPLINKAFTFASAAHAAVGQVRKYSGEPYIVHPVEVACRVTEAKDWTNEMVAAALLHDVVEDTDVTIDLIDKMFNPVVMNHVSWLTDISKGSSANRAARKKMDREHTWAAPKQSQTIKVCDLIANTRDITSADPNFAVVYMKEKRLLLEGMNADEGLMQQAWALIHEFEKNK